MESYFSSSAISTLPEIPSLKIPPVFCDVDLNLVVDSDQILNNIELVTSGNNLINKETFLDPTSTGRQRQQKHHQQQQQQLLDPCSWRQEQTTDKTFAELNQKQNNELTVCSSIPSDSNGHTATSIGDSIFQITLNTSQRQIRERDSSSISCIKYLLPFVYCELPAHTHSSLESNILNTLEEIQYEQTKFIIFVLFWLITFVSILTLFITVIISLEY